MDFPLPLAVAYCRECGSITKCYPIANATFKVGMAVVLVEGGDQLSGLVGQYNKTVTPGRSGAMQLAAAGLSGHHFWLLAAIIVSVATVC